MQELAVQIPSRRSAARRLLRTSEAARAPLLLPTDDRIVSVDGDDPCRVLLVGSGLAAGVGAASHEHALTGAIARVISGSSGRGVAVESRATAHSLLSDVPALLASVPRGPVDAVVVTAGMMEAVSITSNRTWERWLLAVLEMMQSRFGDGIVIVLAGMPAPSSAVLTGAGRRARFVDRRAVGLNRVSELVIPQQAGWRFVALEQAEHVRGQPTPDAYRRWATQLGDILTTAMAARPI